MHRDPFELYLYADSINDFICWSCDEIIQSELDISKNWIDRGDAIRDSGDSEQALTAYKIGLAYNPTSESLLDRVRKLTLRKP